MNDPRSEYWQRMIADDYAGEGGRNGSQSRPRDPAKIDRYIATSDGGPGKSALCFWQNKGTDPDFGGLFTFMERFFDEHEQVTGENVVTHTEAQCLRSMSVEHKRRLGLTDRG